MLQLLKHPILHQYLPCSLLLAASLVSCQSYVSLDSPGTAGKRQAHITFVEPVTRDRINNRYRCIMRDPLPGPASAINNRAADHILRQEWDQAETILMELVSVAPGYSPALNNLGVVLEQKKLTRDSLDRYLQAAVNDTHCSCCRENMESAAVILQGHSVEAGKESNAH